MLKKVSVIAAAAAAALGFASASYACLAPCQEGCVAEHGDNPTGLPFKMCMHDCLVGCEEELWGGGE